MLVFITLSKIISHIILYLSLSHRKRDKMKRYRTMHQMKEQDKTSEKQLKWR